MYDLVLLCFILYPFYYFQPYEINDICKRASFFWHRPHSHCFCCPMLHICDTTLWQFKWVTVLNKSGLIKHFPLTWSQLTFTFSIHPHTESIGQFWRFIHNEYNCKSNDVYIYIYIYEVDSGMVSTIIWYNVIHKTFFFASI